VSDWTLRFAIRAIGLFSMRCGPKPIFLANRTFPRRFVLAALTNFVTLQENPLSAVSVQTA